MYVHGIEFAFAATPVPDETPPPAEILDKVEIFDLWRADSPPHYTADTK
ncbi:conserved domain protein [delta proteobacterium NaphS2]|nr:conserved domain protein [delta proteobacterium NaphS2]